MKSFGDNFEKLSEKNPRDFNEEVVASSKCNLCLRLVRLYLFLFLGVFILDRFAVSTAANVQRVIEGDKGTLNCTSNTTLPTPVDYTWYGKDGAIPPDILRNSSTLVFPVINRTLSGIYVCSYRVNGSMWKNESLQLIVQYPPHVTSVTSSNSVSSYKPGNSFTISCTTDSEPAVNRVIWTLNKITLKSASKHVTISNAKCSDSGVYECFPSNGIGLASVNGSITINIQAPSPPLSVQGIPHVQCCVVKVYLNWTIPVHVNGPNEELSYKVYYKIFNTSNSTWSNTPSLQWPNYTFTELQPSSAYIFKVQACNKPANCCSQYSNETSVSIPPKECSSTNPSTNSDSDSIHKGGIRPVTIILIVILALVIVFLILVACLRYRGGANAICCTMPFKGLFSPEQTSNTSISRVTSFKEKREKEAIPYERFWNHVILRHADTNYRFSSEFESLGGIVEKNKKLTWIHSQRPENQPKNRFANVVAYDQTRVVLSMIDNVHGSHYINANYVDSYNAMNFYIATQGPLANTMADFWRMVWEQNSRVIVMITNIIEKGRHKCAHYWPTKTRTVQDHGQLRVTFLKEENFAFYSHREFEVKPLKENVHYTQDSTDEAIKPMIVQQFHFTGWPDHGVPEPGYEIAVLDFIFKSTAAQVEGAGPLIVHCSAGVGRSGTYIVIDSMVKRIHDNGDIDIFNFLCQIRQQRNHLVQEECQYIFIHDVILEYVQCGFLLSLPKKALKDHLFKLRVTPHSFGKTKLAAEFEKLNSIKIPDYNLKEGSRTCNINKNRNTTLIPVDTCRVKLYPRPGEEGSDYINASYLDGFWRREAYIVTQYPLESTIFDFWRMVWQENCRSMVMLISKNELEQCNVYPRYLPVVHDTARFGVYEVTMESESARGDLMIRDLIMTSLNEPGETRRIRHFHFLHWPEDSHPWSGQSLLQLVSKVDEWERHVKAKSKPFEMIGPMVVHCSTGTGRSGVYCALHTLWHQVVQEEVISVYPYTRLYFYQRPQILHSQAQFEFIYDTMVEYIDADCSLYLV